MSDDIATTLQDRLAEARRRYERRRPRSLAANREASRFMPGGNTRTVLYHEPFPVCFARGEGARLVDVDGHAYLDFLGEYTAGVYGHSHPDILAAVDEALADGLNLGGHHAAEASFAEAVCRRFGLDLVRFTNSGSEANLMALTAARNVTGREKVAVFDGGYHGGLLYFAGGLHPVNAPFEYVLLDYNDIEKTRAVLDAEGDALAAVLVEPMIGAGGCIPGHPDFLAMLRETTRRHASVLIFDEVMTSRIGRGGLARQLGIAPDMKTLGKYIGGGMSFGAFGGREEIMTLFDPARPEALPHAGTFNNNTLTMRVGQHALTAVYTPEAAEDLDARGDGLRQRLNDLAQSHQAPLKFSGIGSLMTAHFTREAVDSVAAVRAADQEMKALYFFELLEQGIYISRRGMVNLSLPLEDRDIDAFVRTTETFLRAHGDLLGRM